MNKDQYLKVDYGLDILKQDVASKYTETLKETIFKEIEDIKKLDDGFLKQLAQIEDLRALALSFVKQ